MSRQAKDEHYGDPEALAMAYAEAVNAEAHDLKRAGVDIIQLDEPWMEQFPEDGRRFGIKAINRALAGIEGHYDRARLLRLRPRRARQA